MPKIETGITDTGEQENPLNRKARRTTVAWDADQQAASGDGLVEPVGARRTGTNYGRPVMGYAARRRKGMR